ncbi:CHAP domain-containing protein [Nonomuraea purpurea]|uniref:CHAP domain-containing protein n=1 Tax=Nonomuraea purpurea TaxID=1849276 RepID=A0ABV8GCY4_9ACTN
MTPEIQRFIELLQSQLGYAGKGAATKFGEWYGNNVEFDADYSSAPWCDMYLSWAAHKLGYQEWIGQFAWTVAHARWFKEHHAWGKAPKPGALVFFDWSGTGQIDNIDHVGVVTKVKGDKIFTIEGNTGGGVVERKERDTNSVVGYGYPERVKSRLDETASGTQQVSQGAARPPGAPAQTDDRTSEARTGPHPPRDQSADQNPEASRDTHMTQEQPGQGRSDTRPDANTTREQLADRPPHQPPGGHTGKDRPLGGPPGESFGGSPGDNPAQGLQTPQSTDDRGPQEGDPSTADRPGKDTADVPPSHGKSTGPLSPDTNQDDSHSAAPPTHAPPQASDSPPDASAPSPNSPDNPTATPTSDTSTSTPTPTASPTSETPTSTPTPTASPTSETPTSTPTATPTSETPTSTPTATPTSETPSATVTPTPSPSETPPTATATPTTSDTPAASVSQTAAETTAPSPSADASASPEPEPTPSPSEAATTSQAEATPASTSSPTTTPSPAEPVASTAAEPVPDQATDAASQAPGPSVTTAFPTHLQASVSGPPASLSTPALITSAVVAVLALFAVFAVLKTRARARAAASAYAAPSLSMPVARHDVAEPDESSLWRRELLEVIEAAIALPPSGEQDGDSPDRQENRRPDPEPREQDVLTEPLEAVIDTGTSERIVIPEATTPFDAFTPARSTDQDTPDPTHHGHGPSGEHHDGDEDGTTERPSTP